MAWIPQTFEPETLDKNAVINEMYPQAIPSTDFALNAGIPPIPVAQQPWTPKTFEAEKIEQDTALPSRGRTALEQGLQGATFNLADEVYNRLGALGAYGAQALTDLPTASQDPRVAGINLGAVGRGVNSLQALTDEASQMTNQRLDEQLQQRPALSIGSNIAGALLTGGAGATTKGGAALSRGLSSGSVLGRDLGLAGRAAKAGAAGATASGLAGFGAGSGAEDRFKAGADSLGTGALVGAALPVVGAAASKVGQAVIPKVDEAIKPLAQRATELGIPLRVDQVAPSRVRNTVQKVSQELPLSGAGSFEEAQKKAFNSALAKTIGQKSEDLGPNTIKNFLSDAEKKFGSAVKGQQFSFGDEVGAKLDSISNEAADNLTEEVANVVKRNVENFKKDILSGTVKGEKLASLRSNLVKKAAKVTGEAKPYIHELIEAIDDEITPQIGQDAANVLSQARKEWRNFKTVEPLLEKATDGMVNPTDLLQRVASSPYIKASRANVGEDELVDLARIGKEFMAKKGGSDTFQKAGLGALAASTYYNPASALGALGGIGVNRAFQKGYNQSQRVIDKAISNSPRSALAIYGAEKLPTTATVTGGSLAGKKRK